MSKHFLKGIIFDLDGTLLDSIHDIAAAMNTVLERNGLPTHTLAEYRTYIGDGVAMLVRRSIAPVTDEAVFEKVRTEYSAQYSAHSDVLTRPFEGIEASLKYLKAAYALAVLSNKGDKDVKKLATQYFGDTFLCAYGQFGEYKVKPSPDLVYVIRDTLGLQTEDCLFVGDSPMDVATAHNAGIKCVAVTWGYRDKDVLLKAGADYICENPADLADVIRAAHPTKGFTYDLTDPAMRKELLHARATVQRLNRVDVLDDDTKHSVMRELFGSLGDKADLNTPFFCDFGSHIHIGSNFFCNYGCTFLDIADIYIGDNVLLAPNVGLFTAGHPLDLQGRLDNIGTGNPIIIGNGVWVGGNVSVLAGVKIGDNAVIGAGSVVTHDIPANCVAAGNPARVLRNFRQNLNNY